MSQINLNGNPVNTSGTLPETGSQAPGFTAVKTDLSEISLSDYSGKKVVLNIFPSLDTSTCAASVREFNKALQDMKNTVVLCISADLPFAQSRFCGAEGLNEVIPLSIFRSPDFGKEYGVEMTNGPLKGLLSRAVVVIDQEGNVHYTQQVPDIVDEPEYDAVYNAVKEIG